MKKSVLLISHSSNKSGGGEDDFYRLLKYLKKYYKIFLIIPEGYRRESFIKYADEYVIIPNMIFPFDTLSLKKYLKYLYVSYKKYKIVYPFLTKYKKEIDISFINSSVCMAEIVILGINKIPFVLSIKEITVNKIVRYIQYKLINKYTSKIVVLSNVVLNLYKKVNKKSSPIIIRSSIEEEYYAEVKKNYKAENRNSFVITNVGVIARIKNQGLLIDALKYYDLETPLEVRFFGYVVEKDYFDKLNKKIKSLKNKFINVKFYGSVEKEEMIKNYLESDIIVITSKYEGMSLVLVESLYLEKPVISTNVGIIPEIIVNGINGIVLEMNNGKILAEKIKKYINEDDYKEKIKLNLYQTYRNNFDMDKYFKLHEKVLFN